MLLKRSFNHKSANKDIEDLINDHKVKTAGFSHHGLEFNHTKSAIYFWPYLQIKMKVIYAIKNWSNNESNIIIRTNILDASAVASCIQTSLILPNLSQSLFLTPLLDRTSFVVIASLGTTLSELISPYKNSISTLISCIKLSHQIVDRCSCVTQRTHFDSKHLFIDHTNNCA